MSYQDKLAIDLILGEDSGWMEEWIKNNTIETCSKCWSVGYQYEYNYNNEETLKELFDAQELEKCFNCDGGGYVCCNCNEPENHCDCGTNEIKSSGQHVREMFQ